MNYAPLMQFTSHIDGKNAKVEIYRDRIEWSRKGLKPPGGVTGVVLSGGPVFRLRSPAARTRT